MSEFSGEAGTIYVQKSKAPDYHPYVVWFEDLCILGDGDSEIEALQDAGQHTIDILDLIVQAMKKTVNPETNGATTTSAAGGE